MKSFIQVTVHHAALIAAAFCLITTASACNRKPATTGDPKASNAEVEATVPMDSVRTIEKLAMFLAEGLWEEPTLENFVKTHKTQQSAIDAYWDANHDKKAKDMDIDKRYSTVAQELTEYAQSLSGGSTYDMAMAAEVCRAISNFNIADEYCGHSGDNFYQDEMRDWLTLNKALRDYYCQLGVLANGYGTISHIVSSQTLYVLSVCREKDYDQLHKGGQFETKQMTIDAALKELDGMMAAADNSLQDVLNMFNDEEFQNKFREDLQELNGYADAVKQQLNRWLTSRNALCKSQGIPEAQTASMVSAMAVLIKTLIEEN